MDWKEYCESYIPKIKEQYFKRVGKVLNLENPVSFTEKIQWLKVYDSSFNKTYCADKILLHDYITKKIGKDICIPIIATYDKPDDINWDILPQKFVIKCNHGSGYNIIIEDKKNIDKDTICKKLNAWLNENYGLIGYELHYCLIKPKILIEEFKEGDTNDLIDYKLFCFNGKGMFWQIITDRRTNEKISHYDMNWNYNPFYDWKKYDSIDTILKPDKYENMIEIAEKIAKDFKFVRVDFYVIKSKIYLGELTFTPADGFQIFKNKDTDLIIGEMLNLQ